MQCYISAMFLNRCLKLMVSYFLIAVRAVFLDINKPLTMFGIYKLREQMFRIIANYLQGRKRDVLINDFNQSRVS